MLTCPCNVDPLTDPLLYNKAGFLYAKSRCSHDEVFSLPLSPWISSHPLTYPNPPLVQCVIFYTFISNLFIHLMVLLSTRILVSIKLFLVLRLVLHTVSQTANGNHLIDNYKLL